MRAFGLVGVLITMAIVVYMLFAYTGVGDKSYMQTVGEAKKQADAQVRDISGKTDDNRPVTQTIKYSLVNAGTKISGVRIDTVEPGGAMQKKYGVLPGDVVVEFPTGAARDVISSMDDAKTWLQDTYARSMPLIVMRGNNRITLPDQRDFKPTAPTITTNTPTPTPVTPTVTPAPTAVTSTPPTTAPTDPAAVAPPKEKPARNIWNQANNLRDQIEGGNK